MAGSDGILAGIRVVEVATYVAGPAAATVMADFGADVIKIEPPRTGDPYRYLYKLTALPACEQNYCWLLDGRNKRSVALDLKSEDGYETLLDLLRDADVLVVNQHPSVLRSLRIDYESLAPRHPRLVYAHMTGYGEHGEECEKPGYDATAWWARSGLMDCVRPGENEPAISTAGMGDHPSSLALLSGILLALFARERSGRGTKVSSSLLANGLWSNSILLQAVLCGAPAFRRITQADAPNALVNQYRTRDGRWFLLALVQEAKDWERLCGAIDRRSLAADPRFRTPETRREHARALISILDAAFAERDFADWQKILDAHDVTFGTVGRLQDMPRDPQVIANEMLVPIDGGAHPGLQTVDSPLRIAGATKRPPTVAPEIGAHTREVLASLGYDAARIDELFAKGVAYESGG
jgi:crotonobetainyl-CoA:carnitine CoA-transferase CaiB-like acyl-CoA transferase